MANFPPLRSPSIQLNTGFHADVFTYAPKTLLSLFPGPQLFISISKSSFTLRSWARFLSRATRPISHCVGWSVGRSVGWSHFAFECANGHYCPCPTARDSAAVYTALFKCGVGWEEEHKLLAPSGPPPKKKEMEEKLYDGLNARKSSSQCQV